jgi:hypothetical protein
VGLRADVFGCEGDRLRVVPGGISDNAARQGIGRKREDQVGGAAYLEGAAALQVLALEEDVGTGFVVERRGGEYRRVTRQRPDPFRRGTNIVSLIGLGQLSEYKGTRVRTRAAPARREPRLGIVDLIGPICAKVSSDSIKEGLHGQRLRCHHRGAL